MLAWFYTVGVVHQKMIYLPTSERDLVWRGRRYVHGSKAVFFVFCVYCREWKWMWKETKLMRISGLSSPICWQIKTAAECGIFQIFWWHGNKWRTIYKWNKMQYCYGKNRVQQEGCFHQQIGYKFKEEASKVLHLNHSFVRCWNSGTADSISEIQSNLVSRTPRIMNNSGAGRIGVGSIRRRNVDQNKSHWTTFWWDRGPVGLKQSRVGPRDRKKRKNPLPNNNISHPHHLPLTPSTLLHKGTVKLN